MVMTKQTRQMLMGDVEMTPDVFLGSKELRDKCIERIELLDKVKQILLLPELECLTTKQLAEYFEVGYEAIRAQYKRNKKEFDEDGVAIRPLDDFKNLNRSGRTVKNMVQQNGKLVIMLTDDTELIIPNRGTICFPKRAILRMGMLLQGSRVSQEIRTQLLNAVENTTPEQRTSAIDEEISLTNAIGAAFATGNMMKFAEACMSLDAYRKRYITEMEQRNAKLTKKNKDLTITNHVLASDILKWTDRASANRLVRVLAGSIKHGFADTFNLIYHELLYKYSISLKARAALRKKKAPLISFIHDDEWIYLYKVVAAICEKCHVNLPKLFAKAKIDVSGLDLTE